METLVVFIRDIISSDIFLLTLTVVVYYGAQKLQRLFPSPLLNPIIIAAITIAGILQLTGIKYVRYYEANGIINFVLGVSVIALSYLMHKNVNRIKGYKRSIVVSTFIGSVVGVVSIISLCYLFGFNDVITRSLEPKSITTPIALTLSESMGGVGALTALAVAIAGIFGNMLGAQILKLVGVKDSVALGLALGSASHAVGTARAMELGALEGAVGGAAIGLMGLFTAIVLPIIDRLFCHLAAL